MPVLVAVESRPKGCDHVALRGLPSLSSQGTMDFLDHKLRRDTAISADGLYLYRPVAKQFALCQTVLGDGQRAIEIFPDVHRVIARPKTWI